MNTSGKDLGPWLLKRKREKNFVHPALRYAYTQKKTVFTCIKLLRECLFEYKIHFAIEKKIFLG